MPFTYRLPQHLEANTKKLNEVPAEYKNLKLSLPGTRVMVSSGDWGIVIKQSAKLGGQYYTEFYACSNIDLVLQVRYESNFISLHAVYEGSAVTTIGDEVLIFKAKNQSLHYIPSGTTFRTELSAGKPFHSVSLSQERSFLARLAITFTSLDSILAAFRNNVHEHLMLPFTRFRNTSRNELAKLKNIKYPGIGWDEYFHNRVSDYVLAYVAQVHAAYTDGLLSEEISKKIDGLILEIKDDPGMPIVISEEAAKMGISHGLLERAFRNKVGTSITYFLIRERIRKAKELLANKTLTIAEIALAVGYNDHSYFTRLFKKETGVTPSELRSGDE